MPPISIVRSIAFSMSNRVRQATETAVSASISTPVTATVLTSAVTRKPGSASSGSIVTAALVSGKGWQSGIELGGSLGGHDAGELGGGDHRALGRGALPDRRRASREGK